MKISHVVAMTENRVIGKQGEMPWDLPSDLLDFKALTLHSTIVMGRKTFDSIGRKPLPDRHNVVITRNRENYPDNVTVVSSWEEAKAIDTDIKVIGGGQIYRKSLPDTKLIHMFIIHDFGTLEGDTHYPNLTGWRIEKRVFLPKHPGEKYDRSYIRLERAWQH